MTKHPSLNFSLVLGIYLLLSACGGGVSVREDIPTGLQSGTHILGEVVKLYTRDQVLQDKLPKFTSGLRNDLLATGMPESDIVDGSEVGCLHIAMRITRGSVACSIWGTTWHMLLRSCGVK